MDYLWILVAFSCGFVVKQIGLPPLVGYLLAGFGLHAYGISADETLDALAKLGITLMLFTIGLKLNLRSLLKPYIYGTAISHCAIWCCVVLAKWALLSTVGYGLVMGAGMTWPVALLVAFALSFSSTVGVVKLLEDKDDLKTTYGKTAVGILVIQDIVAVLFLVIATGEVPSVYAVCLMLLIPLRPLLNLMLEKGGHGELLPLSGFLLALGGYQVFELVSMKGDLGALVVGILMAPYPKASELYKSLIGFKDLFLIGFFLSIGFTALPTADMLVTAGLMALLLVLKFVLFFAVFLFFRMRPRNAFLGAVALSNFSEFGLIVANLAVDKQWLSQDWLVIIALAVTFSLVISSVVSNYMHSMYTQYKHVVNRFQIHQEKFNLVKQQPDNCRIVVIGLGRVGTATYDALAQKHPGQVLGLDVDEAKVNSFRETGRQVIQGDGEDADFWDQFQWRSIELVMISTAGASEMRTMIKQIRGSDYKGKIACVARYADEHQPILDIGADAVFSYFSEVGVGFAEEGGKLIEGDMA